MPLWMFMALMAPFTFGVLNVVDKMVVERYTPSIYLYAFWIAVLEIPLGVFVLLGLSLGGVDWSAIGAGMLLGAIRACSLLMLLAALRHGQLARVAPVYYLNPIMVAPMSAIFLGEVLSGVIWGAIVLSVLGAGLVTWQGQGAGGAFSQPRAQVYALLAAFIFASSNIVAKWILDTEPLWDVFAASRIGIGVAMGLASLCTAEVTPPRPRDVQTAWVHGTGGAKRSHGVWGDSTQPRSDKLGTSVTGVRHRGAATRCDTGLLRGLGTYGATGFSRLGYHQEHSDPSGRHCGHFGSGGVDFPRAVAPAQSAAIAAPSTSATNSVTKRLKTSGCSKYTE